MINELRAKILSELQQIEGVAEIFDGIPQKFNGFPSIFFNFDRVESQNLDSNHNQRQYYFQINIFQETTTLGNRQSELNLCDILDKILDKFDRSDLDGLALKIDAVGGDVQSVETESGPTLHAIVLLAIHSDFSLGM
ncbi:MAG: hypothetical protein DLD55_00045 [candidate division SR1 bacterium]|nr:MAG: hypothetical protein DLD55_00045 [candidate division SR1 bacterium]